MILSSGSSMEVSPHLLLFFLEDDFYEGCVCVWDVYKRSYTAGELVFVPLPRYEKHRATILADHHRPVYSIDRPNDQFGFVFGDRLPSPPPSYRTVDQIVNYNDRLLLPP